MTELPENYTRSEDDRSSFVADHVSTRELVGDLLEELEARGVRWSEILNVLADVAQMRGQHKLAHFLATATHEVSRLEARDEV